jgi:hypothetical protein
MSSIPETKQSMLLKPDLSIKNLTQIIKEEVNVIKNKIISIQKLEDDSSGETLSDIVNNGVFDNHKERSLNLMGLTTDKGSV